MTSKLTVDQIFDGIASLNLKDIMTLVKQIEDTYGISAAAPVAVMGAAGTGAAAAGGAAAVEEKTEFDVILKEVDPNQKVNVIKAVRTITNLGLKEAKDLVEAAPQPVKQGVSKEEAEKIKKQLDEAGGKGEIK